MTCHPERGCPSNTHNLQCGYPNCAKGQRDEQARASVVRVIEAPKPPEPMRSRCKCGALLEFGESAVQYGPEHQIDGRLAFVRCPHCNEDHYFTAAKVQPCRCQRCAS